MTENERSEFEVALREEQRREKCVMRACKQSLFRWIRRATARDRGLLKLMKTYEETVEAILEIPKFTTKNKLEHTKELLYRLGNPQKCFQVIHVAGSNGKGSVCAYIESVLRKAGKQTGLFTSPHLVCIEERFALNGKTCNRDDFLSAADQVSQVANQMVNEGLPHPTFFEYIFAVGMLIFAKAKVEYAVLETGLGGRLDATNIIENPILTVITAISLEHTEILGETIEKIAVEKAGILKQNVPVVFDASLPEVEQVVTQRAKELNCPIYAVFPKNIKILLNTGKKIAFSYVSGYDVTELEIPFAAPYQAYNAVIAYQAVNCLAKTKEIPNQAIMQGIAQVSWKGRMQQVCPEVYLDGAHNVDGMDKFLEAAGQITDKSSILLCSMVKDKDYVQAVKLLLDHGSWQEIILTTIQGERGVDSQKLAELFQKIVNQKQLQVKITEIEKIEMAYAYALKAKKPGQALFCAGSLYLIGELERIAGGME